jgi:hypothetical protein
VRFSRRGSATDATATSEEPSVADDAATDDTAAKRKGRPTPKRRDAEGRRGPVKAPTTRKEAAARQRQLAREERANRAAARPRSVAEQRAAIRRGDESALPRRDRGPTRRLARNYVDSHRMFSNYLLWLFPLMIAASFVKALAGVQLVVLALFLALMGEWYVVGRRVRKLALERFGSAEGGPMGIGFYAGSRAYLPRRWRMPAPQVNLGDEI